VQVCADGVGSKSIGNGSRAVSIPETRGTVPQVKPDSALSGFKHIRFDVSVVIYYGELPRIDMGVNITWAEFFENQHGVGPLGWTRPKIDHDGHAASIARFNCFFHRFPGGVHVVKWRACPVMCCFDADDYFAVFEGGFCRAIYVKCSNILLGRAHTGCRNIYVSQDPCFCLFHDGLAKMRDFLASGRACIHACRYARMWEMCVWIQACTEETLSRCSGEVGVDVNIDQSGCYYQTRYIYHMVRFFCVDIRFYFCNFPICNSHIT